LGKEKLEILLQTVARTDAGGFPAIFCFGAKTGKVRFEIAGQFLQAVDSARSKFLTTTWKWKDGRQFDDAIPLRKLLIWDGQTLRSRQIGPGLDYCEGACFVPGKTSK
jgi:hypothetical protein